MEKLNDVSVTSIPRLYWCWGWKGGKADHIPHYVDIHSYKLEPHKVVMQIGVAQHSSSKSLHKCAQDDLSKSFSIHQFIFK